MYDIVMLSSATLAGGLPIIVRGVDAPPVQISNQRSELPVSIIAYERTRDKFQQNILCRAFRTPTVKGCPPTAISTV
jgi:hypothetical protein